MLPWCIISIPKGSIKSWSVFLPPTVLTEFQFQKVRLKVTAIPTGVYYITLFQFQKVRLKEYGFGHYDHAVQISIPKGSIKSLLGVVAL